MKHCHHCKEELKEWEIVCPNCKKKQFDNPIMLPIIIVGILLSILIFLKLGIFG